MRLFISLLFIYSVSLFSTEYTYNPPVGVDVNALEFTQWQQERIKQGDIIDSLVQHSNTLDKATDFSARYLNRLIFEASPYLLRHALNPVDWYPWHANTLAKAKLENKLIFLSIGYSTCHWCHVMEQESFTNLSIAKILNQHFVSIKVDRELTPDVDQYFTQALALTQGSAGWPINAILTANAELIWLDSYLSPQDFSNTLSKLSKVWQSRPEAVRQVAKNIAGQLKGQNNIAGIAWDIDKSEQIVKTLVSNLDAIHGGLAGDRKFPNASALQLLIYQYQLTPDPELGIHIRRFLDQLANQGIRDHLNGGFYRYSTDVRWQQPHFEKMLYNQALLISAFSKAYQVFKDERYKLLVIDTIAFVRKWFESQEGAYYSGVDADYLGNEGRYYTFSPEELSAIAPSDLNQFLWCNYNASKLTFPCSSRQDGELTDARQALLLVKSGLAKPHIDRKVITAWNALMISAFVDAYVAFNDEVYLTAAKNLANVINKQQINQSGLLMRASYHNKLSGKAVLNDYAYLAHAMFTLFQQTQNKKWYQLAVHFYQQGSKLFGINYQGEISLSNSQLDDGELLSAHTMLVSLGDKLRSYGEKNAATVKQQISQLKQAAMNSSSSNFSLHEFFLKDKFGVFDNKQFFAKGKGHAQLTLNDNSATIFINLTKGWHINSNEPKQKFLIPTKLASKTNMLSRVQYPAAKIKVLGFNQSKLSLFEGSFQIKAHIDNLSELGGKIELSLQACSDKVCLLPEKLSFYFAGK